MPEFLTWRENKAPLRDILRVFGTGSPPGREEIYRSAVLAELISTLETVPRAGH